MRTFPLGLRLGGGNNGIARAGTRAGCFLRNKPFDLARSTPARRNRLPESYHSGSPVESPKSQKSL